MARKLGIAAMVLLGLWGVVFVATWGYAAWYTRAARLDAEAAVERKFRKHREAFEEDHRLLAAHPLAAIWSPADGPGRDAGPFLNPLVGWVGADDWRAPEGLEPLTATEELRAAVEGDAFWEHPEAVPLPRAALAQLDSLAAFDRWEITAGDSPLATWAGPWEQAPIPNFVMLIALQKARHAQGLLEGDPAASIRTGRALAKLSFGSSLLIGSMVGVSILQQEAKVAAAATARGQSLGELVPLDAALGDRLKRAALGGLYAWQLGAPTDAVALRPTILAGRCGAIQENAGVALFFRPWVAGEDASWVAGLRAALDEPGCTNVLMRRAWDRPVDTSAATASRCLAQKRVTSTPGDCEFGTLAPWMPGVRGMIGDVLIGIAAADRLKYYEPP